MHTHGAKLIAPLFTLLAVFFASASAHAEVRTITATGEYRMGDNDTRTDAKRLALLDAKRLALEQAGTYLESVTEVKNLGVARDELNAYTAGIVEVTELDTKDVLEGATHVIHVQVTAKIDTDIVARQIDALRKNEIVKAELLRAREKAYQLQRERDALQRELAAAKSKTEVDALMQKRREVLTGSEVNSLLTEASIWLSNAAKTSSSDAAAVYRARARSLIERALALAPSEPEAHFEMGVLLYQEGNLYGAIAEYRMALRLKPDHALTHLGLGEALQFIGDLDGAIAAYRTALRLDLNFAAATAHTGLGLALQRKGDLDGAITEYRTALLLKPDNVNIRYILGSELMLKGLKKEATHEFRELLRRAPDTPDNRELIQKARA